MRQSLDILPRSASADTTAHRKPLGSGVSQDATFRVPCTRLTRRASSGQTLAGYDHAPRGAKTDADPMSADESAERGPSTRDRRQRPGLHDKKRDSPARCHCRSDGRRATMFFHLAHTASRRQHVRYDDQMCCLCPQRQTKCRFAPPQTAGAQYHARTQTHTGPTPHMSPWRSRGTGTLYFILYVPMAQPREDRYAGQRLGRALPSGGVARQMNYT